MPCEPIRIHINSHKSMQAQHDAGDDRQQPQATLICLRPTAFRFSMVDRSYHWGSLSGQQATETNIYKYICVYIYIYIFINLHVN